MVEALRTRITTVLLLATWIPSSEFANILAVFPHTGKSHYFMFQPFVYKLAERGHSVTVITHFPDENPPSNITFVSLRVPEDTLFFNSFDLHNVENLGSLRAIASVIGLQHMGVDVCRKGLSHPNFQAFLKKNKQFDLAIVEFFNTDCFASLAYLYQAPLIGIFSSVMMPWHNGRLGNPDNPAYVSNHFLQHPSRMNFVQRITNTLMTFGSHISYYLFFDPPADALVREFIKEDIPPVREIVKNTSILLINSHFTLFQPRPLVPGVIELGGFHVTPSTGNIPSDILQEIEEAPNGVIFFSFGSTIRCATMPEFKLKIFQKVLSQLPQKVIWKWEEEEMPGKPANVVLGKWFPQNEILGHPKVKLFITHSGLMGTEEAVYHGVPMLMLPIFGDQPVNAASCAEKGIGVIVDYYSLTEKSLTDGLNTVLSDHRYTDNAKHLAKVFMDRPLSIMDTAIYWTEYVIRYKGAKQLRSASVDLSWYQEALLDVFAFLLLLLTTFCFFLRKVFSFLCCRKSQLKKKMS